MQNTSIIKTLKNGLKVVFVPFENTELVTFRLKGRAGALWEDEKALGVAHYLEHVVHEGTKKYSNSERLGKVITNLGGKTNASTSYVDVSYKVKLLKKHYKKGFEYLSQIALHPLLETKGFENNRDIIIQELQRDLDNPVSNFFIESLQHIYPKNNRKAHDIIGTMDSLRLMKLSDLKNFHRKNYIASNFVLGVGGNLKEKDVFKLAEEYFSDMPSGDKNSYVLNQLTNSLKIVSKNEKSIQQATYNIVFKAPKTDSNQKYASIMLSKILGGDQLSRLFIKIRQKNGMAYSVGANYTNSKTNGIFSIYAQLNEQNIIKATKIIQNEITTLINKPVNKTEFERVKNGIITSFVSNNEDSSSTTSIETTRILEEREEETFDHQLEMFRSVTRDDILNVANSIFSNKPKVLLLSNSFKKSTLEKLWKA